MNLKRITALALGLMMVVGMAACGEESYRLVKLVEMTGDVTYTREGQTAEVYDGMNFENGDGVATGEESKATISLDSDKFMYMGANTTIEMEAEGNEEDSRTVITLTQGEISCEVQNALSENSMYEVHTSNATIGIHGTIFYVKATEDKTIVYCEEGEVEVTAGSASQTLKPAEAVIVENSVITTTTIEEIMGEVSDTFSPVMTKFTELVAEAKAALYAGINYETSRKYDLCTQYAEELVGSVYVPEDFEIAAFAGVHEEDAVWTEEEAGYEFKQAIFLYSDVRGISSKDGNDWLTIASYTSDVLIDYFNGGAAPVSYIDPEMERIELEPVAGGHECFVVNVTYVDSAWERDRAETYWLREYTKQDGSTQYMYMKIKTEYIADWTKEDYQYFAYEIFGM